MSGLVTVGIPVLNGARYLEEVLSAIRSQSLHRDVQILVVDSGSTDGSVDIAKSFGAVLHEIPRAEFSHGDTRNLIMRLAEGDHVAFLTQDATPADDGWLAALLEGFEQAPDVAAVFGPHVARPDAPHMIARELEQHFETWGSGDVMDVQRLERTAAGLAAYRADPGRYTFLSSVNCCLARWAWQQIPFRDVPYAEDQLLGRELIEAGLAKVFHPRGAVLHSHHHRPLSFMRRYFDEYRGLREVLGHVEPRQVRASVRSVQHLTSADRAWLVSKGVHGPDLQRALWQSRRHHALRLTGAILGSRANRLHPAVRRRLSYEGRSTFDPIDVPRSVLLDDPVRWPRKPVEVEAQSAWDFISEAPSRREARFDSHHGRPRGPLTIAWVVPPWGVGSGGHMTIFRLVRELERLGHSCAVFVFDPFGMESRPGMQLREEVRREFVPIRAPVFVGLDRFHSADIAIATNWWTAYPVSGLPRCLEKAYLVQDFEPWFHPVSAESMWARETYDMHLRCLVFTPWLADVLRSECGVDAFTFTYGTDTDTYTFGPFDEREPGLVVLYARRETPRRAVELALAGLNVVVEQRPGTRVVLFGSGLRSSVPFRCEDVGVLKPPDLARLYRSANVGVALSMTNLSLVSLEMLASGVPLVELDGENVRSVLGESGELAMLASPYPEAIASAVTAILDDRVSAERMAQRGRAFVEARGWDRSGRELADLLGKLVVEERVEANLSPPAGSATSSASTTA